ncbi:hypothetical protein RB195_014662 [Necator americanus]|uniref:Uncharacterized protein n=1 Tax=Necator americanus TaxID=51031 RepID=A0ABR1E146_NECAM
MIYAQPSEQLAGIPRIVLKHTSVMDRLHKKNRILETQTCLDNTMLQLFMETQTTIVDALLATDTEITTQLQENMKRGMTGVIEITKSIAEEQRT